MDGGRFMDMQPTFERHHFEGLSEFHSFLDLAHARNQDIWQGRVDDLERSCSSCGTPFEADNHSGHDCWVIAIFIQRPLFLRVSKRFCTKCQVGEVFGIGIGFMS
jgi:hypothetical protein